MATLPSPYDRLWANVNFQPALSLSSESAQICGRPCLALPLFSLHFCQFSAVLGEEEVYSPSAAKALLPRVLKCFMHSQYYRLSLLLWPLMRPTWTAFDAFFARDYALITFKTAKNCENARMNEAAFGSLREFSSSSSLRPPRETGSWEVKNWMQMEYLLPFRSSQRPQLD